MTKPVKIITHEAFIQRVYALALKRPQLTKEDHKALSRVRLTYGAAGDAGLRGVTWHDKWDHGCDAHGKRCKGRKPQIGALICVHGSGQQSVCQLIGTTLHELAHAMAGPGAGHMGEWRAACARVGLPAAVNGTEYTWDSFDPEFVPTLKAIPVPNDGMPRSVAAVIAGLRKKGGEGLPPALRTGPLPAEPKVKPCGAGFGVRGGTSRGKGSGSRMLKYTCDHKGDKCGDAPKVLRCASTSLKATCATCGEAWKLDEASLPPSHGMGASGQGVPAATARAHGARKPLARRKSRVSNQARHKAVKRASQAPIVPKAPELEPGAAPAAKPDVPFCEAHNAPSTQCGGPHDAL